MCEKKYSLSHSLSARKKNIHRCGVGKQQENKMLIISNRETSDSKSSIQKRKKLCVFVWAL